MKPKVIKSIMVPFGKNHFLPIWQKFKFLLLAQVEQINGSLNLNNPQSAWNHFGLLIIFLVLVDHEMMC